MTSFLMTTINCMQRTRIFNGWFVSLRTVMRNIPWDDYRTECSETLGAIVLDSDKRSGEGNSWLFCGAVEDIAKQAVSSGAADEAISSILNTLTGSQKVAQNIVGCLMKTPEFTAFITYLVRRHVGIAIVKEAKLYDPSTDVGKKNRDGTPRSSLKKDHRLLQYHSNMTSRRHSERRRKPLTLLDCHAIIAARAGVA